MYGTKDCGWDSICEQPNTSSEPMWEFSGQRQSDASQKVNDGRPNEYDNSQALRRSQCQGKLLVECQHTLGGMS